MLNSNQVGTVLFKLSDIQKLPLHRLKSFKKACERRQRNFTIPCGCPVDCFNYHVKRTPEQFTASNIAEYEIWSTNMTMISNTINSHTNS